MNYLVLFKMKSLLTVMILFTVMLSGLATAGGEKLIIPRAQRAPVLSDYIGTVPSDAGVEVSGFRQRTPGDGEPASRETKAWLSYDNTHLYAVFVAKDDPKDIRAHIARREDFSADDYVILELDTFHDKQRSFVFFVNPHGVQFDAKRTEGLNIDFAWDTQWKSDGKLTTDGYVVTLAIPFKSLRFRPEDTQDWGIALGRKIARFNEASYWPYITKRIVGLVPQFATAEIKDKIPPGRNIQLIPYGFLGRSRALNGDDPNQPYFERQNTERVGIDAKFVLNNAFAIDLTVNPDFSEVESDEPQVIIDKRYEVEFPEKRPFFLENSGFFTTPRSLFFSRRIIDPKLGVRATGRHENWSFGGLVINDKAPGKLLAASDENFNADAKIGVARIQRDFAKDSNVGVLLTSRKLGSSSNVVGGADLRWNLDQNWVLTGQLARSESQATGNVNNSGQLSYFEARRTDRNFNYIGRYLNISKDFESVLAFVPRTDIRQLTQTASYLWNFSENSLLQSIGPQFSAVGTRNQQGETQDWSSDLALIANAQAETLLEAHLLNGFERFDQLAVHKQGYSLSASTEWLSWLASSFSVGRNEVINYAPSAATAAFLGDARSVSATFKFTPSSRFTVEETLFWNDLRTKNRIAGQAADTSVYRDLITRTKVSYLFNRFLSIRAIFDYSLRTANSALTVIEPGKRLNTDIQLSYIPYPGTTFYVGYADRRDNLELIGNPAILRRTDDLNLNTGRSFFMKLSYLFQF